MSEPGVGPPPYPYLSWEEYWAAQGGNASGAPAPWQGGADAGQGVGAWAEGTPASTAPWKGYGAASRLEPQVMDSSGRVVVLPRALPKGESEGADHPPKTAPFMEWPGGGGGSLPGTTYASAGQPQGYNSERLLGRLEDMRLGNINQSQYVPWLRRF